MGFMGLVSFEEVVSLDIHKYLIVFQQIQFDFYETRSTFIVFVFFFLVCIIV